LLVCVNNSYIYIYKIILKKIYKSCVPKNAIQAKQS